ncbi:MAG: bifunctional pyr operon transcriptional regulator/uracil phosphoribosyltransferase PyrR [Gammaproteobacteria bacterium]
MSTTTKHIAKHIDAEASYQALLAQTRAGLAGVPDAAIVGIHTGGAWVAERLAADLRLTDRLGFIDISFYRDDYAKKGLQPHVKSTQIGFNVDHATIVLVDDVLFTGRTVRAAVNVLFDYGRPARIMLAALADRGGRELPVAADFSGVKVELAASESLKLTRNDAGQFSLTIQEDHA